MTAEVAKPQPQASPAATVEKQANCLACGKPLKRLKRYYRDGKFYCTKKCWRKSITEKKAKA
jgi:predicted transcriptional regulator